MYRNECLFLDGSLGDPEKRMQLPEKVKMTLKAKGVIETYEVYADGGLIVFDCVGVNAEQLPAPAVEKPEPEKEKKPEVRRGEFASGPVNSKPVKKTATKKK